jgi:hypothetical protein
MGSPPFNRGMGIMKVIREYGTNGNDGTDGISLGVFCLFRHFRLFRILSSTWQSANHG